MAKLTRKSYNRKIFMLGGSLFLSVGLISTGLATWVISNGTTQNGEGNLNVGIIEDGGLQFSDIVFDDATGNKFMFEPAKEDILGDIKWDEDKPTEYENLSVKFTTTLSPKSFINGVKIKLDVPEGVKKAAEANYIVLPDCSTTEGIELLVRGKSGALEKASGIGDELTFEDIPGEEGAIKISYTISFKWGSELSDDGVTNPSIYLDEATNRQTGLLYTFDEKMEKIIKFRRTIYQFGEEVTDEEVATKQPSSVYTFNATLTAEAN